MLKSLLGAVEHLEAVLEGVVVAGADDGVGIHHGRWLFYIHSHFEHDTSMPVGEIGWARVEQAPFYIEFEHDFVHSAGSMTGVDAVQCLLYSRTSRKHLITDPADRRRIMDAK